MAPRIKGLFVLDARSFDLIYPEALRARFADLVDIYAPLQTAEMVQANPYILSEADVIFSGWGCPVFDRRLLSAAGKLKVVFYGAGSVRYLVSEEFWQRDIQITSAYAANAVPVAEFTLAHILLGLKSAWQHAMIYRRERTYVRLPVAGGYGGTVGLVSLGMIGRLVAERLSTFDLNVLAYDPYVSSHTGVTMVSLEELFQRADVVSVHTPLLNQTEGLLTGQLFSSMKPYATFINTSRGAVVREAELVRVLAQRPDLTAVLDVTSPEPPTPDSPLFTLPNVVLTPHIAGSMDAECRRMGEYMLAELHRYLAGELLEYRLTPQKLATMA